MRRSMMKRRKRKSDLFEKSVKELRIKSEDLLGMLV